MNPIRYSLIVLLLPFVCRAQGIVNAGIGRTDEEEFFNQTVTIDLNYLYAFESLALKAGTMLEPNTNFRLKYTFLGSVGFTSLLDKMVSVHLLAGLANTGSTQTRSINKDFYFYKTLSPSLNLGFLFAPSRSRHFILGLEAYYWKQKVDYGHAETFIANALSVSLSAGYRFNNRPGSKKLKDK